MIFNSTTPAIGTPPADDSAIVSGAFWPPADPATARAVLQLNGNVTPAKLRHALIRALASVNQELADWRMQQQSAGITQLADLPAEQVDGESRLVHHWRDAVYSLAGADLADDYRNIDATGKGEARADELNVMADQLRSRSREALRAVMGQPRLTVELI